MTATAHALIGAAIAAKVINPYLGIPLAILSHFAADLIPHWDEGTNHKQKSATKLRIQAVFDVLLGFALAFLIFGRVVDETYLFVMIIAAQLPDWLESPAFMFNVKIPPFSWMYWVSHNLQSRMQLPWGLVTQVVVVGIVLLLSLGVNGLGNSLAGF